MNRRLILPKYPSEQAFVDDVLGELADHFHIKRQVSLRHWTGARLIVDALLTPRDPQPWKDEKPVFAVEFKKPGLFHTGQGWGSTREFTAWAAQAVDYANCVWNNRRLRVFTCPSVTEPFAQTDGGGITDSGFFIPRFLWQLGVGELVKIEDDGWTLVAQGDHILWSQQRGVYQAKRWSIAPKLGSR
jgi:hypothetical protein